MRNPRREEARAKELAEQLKTVTDSAANTRRSLATEGKTRSAMQVRPPAGHRCMGRPSQLALGRLPADYQVDQLVGFRLTAN